MKTLIALALVATTVAAVSVTLPSRSATKASSPAQVFLVDQVTPRGTNKAVEFTWKDGAKTMSFAEVTKGKVVLLNIWATWCGPCRRELPDLVALSQEMASKGVVIIGVSLDEKEPRLQNVKTFVEKMGIPYVNVIDNLKISDAYGGIQSIPTTFIIDRQGNIVQKIVGMQSKEAFRAAITKAL
jgi:thiol-disulfide isomerase/thioredoxin